MWLETLVQNSAHLITEVYDISSSFYPLCPLVTFV